MPTAGEWLALHACIQASLCAALAPLFGNNPAVMAAQGMFVGVVTGLPAYVYAVIRRGRR